MEHLAAVATYVLTHPLGVILAVILSIATGFLWHGPLFGKTWIKLNKIGGMSKKEQTDVMIRGLTASVIMGLVQAAVIGRALEILYLPNVAYAFIIATILWLPFTCLTFLNNYVWARRPMTLFLLDAGYTLAVLWVIAAVLYVTL